MSNGDRISLAVVLVLLVGLVLLYGPDRVGHLASAGTLLLALWLALRTLAAERPSIDVSSRIVELQPDVDAAVLAAIVEVRVINLSRTPNAVREVEISFVREANSVSAPASEWRRVADDAVLVVATEDLSWTITEEPARFPIVVAGLSATRFIMFCVAPATPLLPGGVGLFSEEEWATSDPEHLLSPEIDSHALLIDLQARTWWEEPPEGSTQPVSLSERVRRRAMRFLARDARVMRGLYRHR
jgi:hypothetical protein